MITERDLRDRVAEWQLRDDVVEKDYVLGWVLAGIGAHPVLRDGWIFKGGTCLKKCFMETFRFSEDLDFTVLDRGPIDEADVIAMLGDVLVEIGRASGIDFTVREPRLRARPNGSLEGRLYYRGPRRAPVDASIRLDLTRGEQLARPPVIRPIHHLYPDDLVPPGTVRCYSLIELHAEKIRAMGERGRPRDLYDIVILLDHPDLVSQGALVHETLVAKCSTKGVPVPTLELLEAAETRAELESEWEHMLGHQLPALPILDHYWSRLRELFEWLDGRELPVLDPARSFSAGEQVWRPSRTRWSWGGRVALDPVRFAGANRLCVDLGYQGSVRRIEPYSLRITRDGNLLLYAIRRRDGRLRSYRVDRIQSVTVTTEPFRPRRLVEFSQGY
jgi:predicted nucleotidyltransferase component of viral defense system